MRHERTAFPNNASDDAEGPESSREPEWLPTHAERPIQNDVTAFARSLGLPNDPSLHRWVGPTSRRILEAGGRTVGYSLPATLSTIVEVPPTRHGHDGFFPGHLNIVESCFQADVGATAIHQDGGTAAADGSGRAMSCAGSPRRRRHNSYLHGHCPRRRHRCHDADDGARRGCYLGVIAAGAVVVPSCRQLSAEEIALRLGLGQVKRVFTQDVATPGGKAPDATTR